MDAVTSNDSSEIITSQVQNISNENEGNGTGEESASASASHSIFSEFSSDSDIDMKFVEEYKKEKERIWYEVKARELEGQLNIFKDIICEEKDNVDWDLVNKRHRALIKHKNILAHRLEAAFTSKQLKLMEINRKYKETKQAVQQNFEDKKSILYDTLKSKIEDEMRQLKEDFKKVGIDDALLVSSLKDKDCKYD